MAGSVEERAERLQALMQSDPEAYAELVAKLVGKMLIPHSDGQKEVLTAEERFLVLCAGRRWGKTKVGAARILREVRSTKKIAWWVAPTYKVVKRGYAEVVAQIPEGVLTKPAPPDSVFDAGRSVRLDFKGGGRIEFYSAERPEGMLGGSCDFSILDEAATMPEHVWTQIIRPTLADRQGSALFISTPRGLNWFYYIWKRGQSKDVEDKEFRSWRFPSRTNPTIPASEFDDMSRDMPQVEYEQEVLAEFISDAAAVFRFPKPRTEDGREIPLEEAMDLGLDSPAVVHDLEDPQGSHVILGLDLAKHADYTVLLGIKESNRKPCYHDRFNHISWPIQRERVYDAVDTILESGASGITIMVDSGGVGDVIFDDLEEAGYDVVPVNFTTWKEKMVRLLSSDLEQGRAYVYADAKSEFEHYGYTVTKAGRWTYAATRGHDDEVSAALLAHWGVVHEGAPNVRTMSGGEDTSAPGDWTPYQDDGDEGSVTDTGQAQERTIRLPSAHDFLINSGTPY